MGHEKSSTEHVETYTGNEKDNTLQREYTLDEEGKRPVEKVDYSGAHEKTDPKEIALVRKLDIWIMPMLWVGL